MFPFSPIIVLFCFQQLCFNGSVSSLEEAHRSNGSTDDNGKIVFFLFQEACVYVFVSQICNVLSLFNKTGKNKPLALQDNPY